MRSIIDEIARAEQQADEIRASAAAKSREQVLAATEEAARALTQLDADAREELRAALERAERDGEALSKRLTDGYEAEADALCAQAGDKARTAVDYLLKRVQEIA